MRLDDTIVVNLDKNVSDQKLISLDHKFLKCYNCGSDKKLLYINELQNPVWCIICAKEESFE